ncbi:MAG: hypothetical protein GWN84_23305 [Gammaproteobacteria bacterium]|nr:hypothetical protein [Gammaproteobacteria bacterium]NIR85530.1 hypothetical protein [Gammaproteobacteria bacterium]NIR89789.1 hypothetical protein [Gammaproteobacteria bacterium]NIU06665.1 hypothetical protein [Gammaproteobacteria bacterium]NIV75056.1 hypothetical protein [Gammaproteobacteria bacterium]
MGSPRAGRGRAMAIAGAWMALSGLPGELDAQLLVQPYESPPTVWATEILPPHLLSSDAHHVDDEVDTDGNFFRFTVHSEYGTYEPASLALFEVRIHEIVTLRQAITQYERGERTFAGSPEGQVRLGEPLTQSDLAAANRVLTAPLMAPGERGGRGQPASPSPRGDPVFEAHKRNVAALYRLDVYSSNPTVQSFLDTVASARIEGRFSAGAGSFILAPPDHQRRIEGGVLEAKLGSRIRSNSREDLALWLEGELARMGADTQLRRRFIGHPHLSPRHQSALVVYLGYLDKVARRDLLIRAALDARDERDALSYEQLARMLALYHAEIEKLDRLETRGSGLPVAVTISRALVVALPVDIIHWSEEAAAVFRALDEHAQRPAFSRREVVLSGMLTDMAKRQLGALVFDYRERFLLRR